jgi:hypothetical protein
LLGFDAVTIQQKSDLYSSSGGKSAFYTKDEVDAFEFKYILGKDLDDASNLYPDQREQGRRTTC